ncbi:MAG: anti-sigma factor [Xanthobacteraceae bacterium]
MAYDDEHDALAAEYVLGTLSAEERDQAEALISLDAGFEASVRQWERRLGELNVMVEAVEPRPEVWEKIKTSIAPAQAGGEAEMPRAEMPRAEGLATDQPSPLAVLDSKLSEAAAEIRSPPEMRMSAGEMRTPPEESRTLELDTLADLPSQVASQLASQLSQQSASPRSVERSADVIYLARRVRRWRRLTLAVGAIAALLAVYVAVWQTAPQLIPLQLRPSASGMLARHDAAPGGGRSQQDRLVAVLQQEPMAPAFLLTVDTQNRTLVLRRVSAAQETGRSYELWLISSRFSAPRSLGIVGNGEFTQHALPANYDVDTLRTASYAVSLEPAGGSPSGVPTGPVLFTGKAVESLPAAPPRT